MEQSGTSFCFRLKSSILSTVTALATRPTPAWSSGDQLPDIGRAFHLSETSSRHSPAHPAFPASKPKRLLALREKHPLFPCALITRHAGEAEQTRAPASAGPPRYPCAILSPHGHISQKTNAFPSQSFTCCTLSAVSTWDRKRARKQVRQNVSVFKLHLL